MVTETLKQKWLRGTAGVSAPLLVVGVILLFPVPLLRFAGCSGDLQTVAVLGGGVVVAEAVALDLDSSGPLHAEKLTVLDARTGKVLHGPWYYEMQDPVGTLGGLYCLSGKSLLCVAPETGAVLVSKATLEGKAPLLKTHWLDDPLAYELGDGDRVAFRTDDGRRWLLNRDLQLSAGKPPGRASPPREASSVEAGNLHITLEGSPRSHLRVEPGGEISNDSWLSAAFLVDAVTGRVVEGTNGWVMTTSDRVVDSSHYGVALSLVNAHGVVAWKTALGDNVDVYGTYLVGSVLVLHCTGDDRAIKAFDVATGSLLWSRSYNSWF